jgi:CelD/BcsL family acetyltransferase involved in cellulose biosynthesis
VTWLSFAQLDARADELDRFVAATPEIDHFCSSSPWLLSAQAAFAPRAQPVIWADDGGVVATMAIELEGGLRAAVPLEASWGLASGVLGPEPAPLVDAYLRALRALPARERPRIAVFSGTAPGGAAARALARVGARTIGPPTDRIVADLGGGVAGFLSRRSSKFRATALRARRAAAARGVSYVRSRVADLDRILGVELRSWKAAEGSGIDSGPMLEFYRAMLPRLVGRGALRVVFVQLDGADIAFCFGGRAGALYRGLQVSFDEAHARLSPGVLAHLEMIAFLADEGVTRYDLGTDMEYKRRWGEVGLRTEAMVVAV